MADLDERAHRNLCDFTRFLARLEPAGTLVDESGIVATIGPTDFAATRTAVRSDTTLPAPAWAEKVDGIFAAHGRTACVFGRVDTDADIADALLARGFVEWSQTPEMVCDRPLEPRDPPAGVIVRWATTPADVTAYAAIAGRAFTHLAIPAEVTRQTIDNAGVMLQPDCAIALAELDGTPVAGALVVLLGDRPNGYVGWVACLDEARGRGLGDVVTRAVTNEGFARGAGIVTLEASPFGEHTYARMGYREVYKYRLLIKV